MGDGRDVQVCSEGRHRHRWTGQRWVLDADGLRSDPEDLQGRLSA